MKIIFYGILMIFFGCTGQGFDENKAFKVVNLSQEDLSSFEAFQELIIRDYQDIREKSLELTSALDTSFLGTNSFYLKQIDISYKSITDELIERGVYEDRVIIGMEDVSMFFLKSNSNNEISPSMMYTHVLIFNSERENSFFNEFEILKDSIISENCKYILYKAQVGH